jgi:hypothetical protein
MYKLNYFNFSCTSDEKDLSLGFRAFSIQPFQLRLSPSKAEKSNTSAKQCWESLINSLIFYRFPAAFRARIRLFRFTRVQP